MEIHMAGHDCAGYEYEVIRECYAYVNVRRTHSTAESEK